MSEIVNISGIEVLLLGMGVVFAGLVCLVVIIKLMSSIVRKLDKIEVAVESQPVAQTAPVTQAVTGAIPNKPEFVAAVSAAIATYMGTEIQGLRIHSIKKIS